MRTRLGTAQWADPPAVEEQYLYGRGTVWLGRSASAADAPLGYEDDRHVLLVSGTRGGKGASSIINNLCLWPGSVVVIDPKGENATVTAARRGKGSAFCEGMGQAVHVIDPFNAADVEKGYRSRFNPLDALKPDDKESFDEAGRIADALIVIHEGTDPFWAKSARAMIWGLILHVLTDPGYEGRRNLLTVYGLIARGDWEAVETLRQSGERDIPPADGLLWMAVARNPAFGGRLANIGEGFVNMLSRGDEMYESAIQEVRRFTEFINSPLMEDCLSASDFDLSELKTSRTGMSLYLSLPQRYMDTHVGWLRMMISLALTGMERVKGQPASGHRVLFLLDEFAGLEHMRVIENGVAQMAGYGVKMFFVVQTLGQLKAVYEKRWEDFIGCSGLKMFFSLDDHFSRDYVSKLIGETEIIREVHSEGDSASESESESESRSSARSESSGESLSHGRSESEGESRSVSRSESHGVNKSHGRTVGGSLSTTHGESWSPGEFFTKSSSGTFTESSSTSDSEGTSESRSRSETEGTSRGSSRSRTEGRSRTSGTSESETAGTTRGTSRGRTTGRAETIHRGPLISPDEIGTKFARVDDRERAAYPGLGLALIAGHDPVAFRRVNYYEDVQFIGLFKPHPDHPRTRLTTERIAYAGLEAFRSGGVGLRWIPTVKRGAVVRKGDVIGQAVNVLWLEIAPIRAPLEGRIVKVPELLSVGLTRSKLVAPGLLDRSWFFGDFEILHYDLSIRPLNPFADVAAYFQEEERRKERERQAEEQRRSAEREAEQARQRRLRINAEAEEKQRQGAAALARKRRLWATVCGGAVLTALVSAHIGKATGSGAGTLGAVAAFALFVASGVKLSLTFDAVNRWLAARKRTAGDRAQRQPRETSAMARKAKRQAWLCVWTALIAFAGFKTRDVTGSDFGVPIAIAALTVFSLASIALVWTFLEPVYLWVAGQWRKLTGPQ